MIDYIVLIALIIAIIHSFKVNQKMKEIQTSKNDLFNIMKNLDQSISKANMCIREINELNLNTTKDLQEKIDHANHITQNISFVTDQASEIASRLDKLIFLTRTINRPKPNHHKKFTHNEGKFLDNHEPKSNKIAIPKKPQNIEAIVKKINYTTSNKPDNHANNNAAKKAEYFRNLKKVIS